MQTVCSTLKKKVLLALANIWLSLGNSRVWGKPWSIFWWQCNFLVMLQELQTVPLPFLKALHISHGWAHILINSVPRSKADTADHAPDFVWSARTQETPNDHFLPLRMDWHHLLAAWSHDWWEFTRTISWCVFFTSVLLGINKMKGEEMRGERAAGLSASHSDSDTFVKSFWG